MLWFERTIIISITWLRQNHFFAIFIQLMTLVPNSLVITMDDTNNTSLTKLERELAEARDRIKCLEQRLQRCDPQALTDSALQDQVLDSMDVVPFYCRLGDPLESIYIGPSIERLFGFPAKDFYADDSFWPSRMHEDDLPKAKARLAEIHKTGKIRFDYRWRVASGEWRWFAVSMRLVDCEAISQEVGQCVTGLAWDINGRKRMEKALIEREERYRTVADYTHDWEFWIGPDGSFLYVSPSFERVTGYLPEELKNKPSLLFETIVFPSDRDMVRKHLVGGLHSDEVLSFDFRIITKGGDVRWLGHVSQPVYDDKGDTLGRRASNRDITELKETVQTLRDKNQFINSMMDNSPATIFAKDVDGRYLFANPQFMEYTGKPVSEVLGKTDYGLFPNEAAEVLRRGDEEVLKSGEPLLEEFTLNMGGRLVHWTTTKFPLLNADGNALGVCGMSLDVTAWREAEASLRRMSRAIDQSPVSIAMTDTAGRIISVNPHFCTVSGYTEAEVLERKLGFMLAEEDERLYDPVWQEVKAGQDWQGEIRNRTKSGDFIWENTSVSPVRDSNGHIVNFVVVKDDITERKRLERLEKDVERIVRHDLKSPIMSFIWVPRKLRTADNITEQQASLLKDMEESAHRMLRMVNLSLDLFHMEEGTYVFVPEDLNILRVISNVLHDLKSTLNALQVRVDVFVSGRPFRDGDCLIVHGEELLCHSMVSNLIRNAVEASSKGDVVTINCTQNDETTISVHNTAVVPHDIRETFFDKYVTSGKRFGTGLGTYSARLVTETQGGQIRMESAEGLGTTLTVTFPAEPSCQPGDDI